MNGSNERPAMRLDRKLLAAAVIAAASLPGTVVGQPAATPPRPAEPAAATTDNLTTQERDLLAAVEQLASDGAQVLEQWIITQTITEDRLFARMYFPIAKTDPQKYSTP